VKYLLPVCQSLRKIHSQFCFLCSCEVIKYRKTLFRRARADYFSIHPQCVCDRKTIGSHLKLTWEEPRILSKQSALECSPHNLQCSLTGLFVRRIFASHLESNSLFFSGKQCQDFYFCQKSSYCHRQYIFEAFQTNNEGTDDSNWVEAIEPPPSLGLTLREMFVTTSQISAIAKLHARHGIYLLIFLWNIFHRLFYTLPVMPVEILP